MLQDQMWKLSIVSKSVFILLLFLGPFISLLLLFIVWSDGGVQHINIIGDLEKGLGHVKFSNPSLDEFSHQSAER